MGPGTPEEKGRNMIEFCLSVIAISLSVIATVILDAWDVKKHAIRMMDVDRAKVYSGHLGKKLTNG